MLLEKINVDDLNYVDLLSYIEETNRCPGGKRTILDIVKNTNLQKGAKVLEIGSNTGFTSIEIAKLVDCKVVGVDVNQQAINKSKEILKKEPQFIQDRITFQLADAANLPFEDETFDLIVTGGANTFIPSEDRQKALLEYKRVLKPYGFLSVTNLFYHASVPTDLLNKLQAILGFEIKPWTKNYWLKLILNSQLEMFYYNEKKMQKRPKDVLVRYVNTLVNESPSIVKLDPEIQDTFRNRWFEIMKVFNKNHEYLSFMFVLLRKNVNPEQQELFLEEGALDIWNLEDDLMWVESEK